jgi:hypothetical protein
MPVLRDLETVEVSLVPRAANLKKFLIFKSAGGNEMKYRKIRKDDNVTNAHKTPPKGNPQSAAQYADPANFKYPIDAGHIKAAVAYFNHSGAQQKGGYSPGQWASIGGKIASAANSLIGKGHSFKNGKIATEKEGVKKLNKITEVMKSIANTQFEQEAAMNKILKEMDISPEARAAAEVACKLLMAYKDEMPDGVFADLAEVAGFSDGSEEDEDDDEEESEGESEGEEEPGMEEDGEEEGSEEDQTDIEDSQCGGIQDGVNDNLPGQEPLAGVTNAANAPAAPGNKPGVPEAGQFPDTHQSQFSQAGVPNSPQPPDMPTEKAIPGKPETSAFGGQAAAKPENTGTPGVPEKPAVPGGGLPPAVPGGGLKPKPKPPVPPTMPVQKLGKPLYKNIGGVQEMVEIKKASDIDKLKIDETAKMYLKSLWNRNAAQEEVTKGLAIEIKKMIDEKAYNAFVEVAKSYENISANPLELATILKGISDVNPEYATKLQAMLKGTNEQLRENGGIFKEYGSAAMGETGSPLNKIDAIAKEKVTKSLGKMTMAQANVQAMEENPEIYAEYKKEHDGRY